jgi:hypothetical protein
MDMNLHAIGCHPDMHLKLHAIGCHPDTDMNLHPIECRPDMHMKMHAIGCHPERSRPSGGVRDLPLSRTVPFEAIPRREVPYV